MKNLSILFSVITIMIVVVTACTKDKKDTQDVLPTCTDSAIDVSYATRIAPVMETYCTGGTCHGTPRNAAGINLESYANVKNATENGSLICSISHLCGVAQMPEGGSKLPDSLIQRVVCWKENGYPQ